MVTIASKREKQEIQIIWYYCIKRLVVLPKQADLPFACNSSRDLQPPIDSGRAFSLLSDILSSSICTSQTQNECKLSITIPYIS
jgi:hypothetical protein